MAPHPRQFAGFILALTLLPSGARAQTVAPHGEQDWQRVDGLARGTKIVVTLNTGEKRIGDFRRATADDVTIDVRPKEGEDASVASSSHYGQKSRDSLRQELPSLAMSRRR